MTHCSLHYLDENRGGAKYWPGISGVREPEAERTASSLSLIMQQPKAHLLFKGLQARPPLWVLVMPLSFTFWIHCFFSKGQ